MQGVLPYLLTTTMISLNQGVITGGQFTQNNYHVQKAPIDTLKDAVAANAFHDSGARFDPPKCHPRTRVKILDDIMGRMVGQSQDMVVKPFLWLNGAAGAGKSAIAQSTIERCVERGVHVASFFFSKSDPTRNQPKPLVATLAYQLYCSFPETEVQTEMLSAIAKDPLIFSRTIQRQFTSLVVQPLTTYLSRQILPVPQTSFLIVIDGLDECIERASQKTILSGLAESVRDSGPYIRIFVASRPEYDITQSFGAKHLKDVHTHLSLDLDLESNVEADIKLYLYEQFEQIKDDCDSDLVFWPKLDQSWPGEEVIEKLARKSSGQFIYAATVIRYVTSARPKRPDRRLDMVLELRPHDGDHPFAELDALYEKILVSCKNIDRVLEVLSLKMMAKYLSFEVLAYEKVLLYEEGEVGRLFCDLGALVMVGIPSWSTHPLDMCLTILHASLSDYLQDEGRSKQFHIDLCGKYIGSHMAKVLNYLASCSDYNQFAEDSLGETITSLFSHNSAKLCSCTIPPELPQAAFSFPLEKFLALHISFTSDATYNTLLFVQAFLHMLRIMALKDPTCSYIEDHQHRNLDSMMILPLQRYFDDDQLALVLVLFYHLGSHRFVPWCNMVQTFKEPLDNFNFNVLPRSTVPFLLLDEEDFYDKEKLCLASLWSYATQNTRQRDGFLIHTDNDTALLAYLDYMHCLLRSISALALTPTVYAKATKECFDTLPLLRVPSFFWKRNAQVMDDTEDDPCPYLIFDDKYPIGPWVFVENNDPSCSNSDSSNRNTVIMEDEEDEQSDRDDDGLRDHEREVVGKAYFTILGYLIFFLPRCGRSDELIAACIKQQAVYIEKPNNPFPIRWRRLHMEINNYLARVSPTSNV
ncbi:hypothetical protein D9613_012028 [Agrocybe pediades]|uniref:Nephrocystin 3-like N-terminal domain-containing protein n=1 Tax=Agrocybe pediades TaxID=84607 RepID=A0A8H4VJ20_9AGAR|nr:hypothetical protein D9613_012028 [Agrocybe pediades]